MNHLEFSVPCLFGLEGLAGDELRRLNIENVRVENGRVLFSGDEIALAKAAFNNYFLFLWANFKHFALFALVLA